MMKRTFLRALSLVLALSLCLPMLFTAWASGETALPQGEESSKENVYDSLYVQDVDGDGNDDSTLLWNAFDKSASDEVLESAFTVAANAYYGNGYLYNDAKQLDLTSYLPNIPYGTQTAQKDFSVELVMSTCAPYQEGTGMSVSGKNWYFGNFRGAFYFRQSNQEYISSGPISVWVGLKGMIPGVTSTSEGFNFNKGSNYLFEKTPLLPYTSTLTFDLTLGSEPDTSKDTMLSSFYYNGGKLSIDKMKNPLPYDAADKNDVLKIGDSIPMNYYAIRVYAGVLTEEQMRQNHFADLAAYAQIDLASFNALSEEERKAIYDMAAGISLADDDIEGKLKKAVEDVLLNTVYVSDVDGDGKSDLRFFYDAYGHKKEDTAPSSISDKFGNTLSLPAGATYGDDCLYLKGKALKLTSFYNANEDIYLDLVIQQTGERIGDSGKTYIGPATISISTKQNKEASDQHPVDASFGVVSGCYWGVPQLSDGASTNWGTDISWNPTHFVGAYIGDMYTIGFAVQKNLTASPAYYTLAYVRDGVYVRGTKNNYMNPMPSNPIAYTAGSDTKVEFGENLCVNYYAIRLYSKVLSEEQRKQNHFADLLSYYRPAELVFFYELSPIGQASVMTACQDLAFGAEGIEDALRAAIVSAYEQEKTEVYFGEYFMDFEGYSMRMVGDYDIRVTYAVDKEYISTLPEHVSVLEMGVLKTAVGAKYGNESMKKDALTLSYAERKDHAEKLPFYTSEDTLPASASVVFSGGTKAADCSTEYMVRGYVLLNLRGAEIALYEDAESKTFGQTISLVSLSAAVYGLATPEVEDLNPESILENVLDETDALFDSLKEQIESAKADRLLAEDKIIGAKTNADQLKEQLKEYARLGKDGDAVKKAEYQAKTAELLTSVTGIKADAATLHPNLGTALASLSEDAERAAELLTIAAEALGRDTDAVVRAEEVVALANEEAKAQATGFSSAILRMKDDVPYMISVIEKIGARIAEGNFGEVKTLKILAIGNSFSNNARTLLADIAASFGYEDIVIGHLMYGGCSLQTHVNYIKNESASYTYHKAIGTTWKTYSNATFADGLFDEDWDVITVQEVSTRSPVQSYYTDGNLDYLLEYIHTNKTNKNAKVYFHATWSYATDHKHPSGQNSSYDYLNKPAEMDDMIAACVEKVILKRGDIDGVLYTGVAVAKAREHFGAGSYNNPTTIYLTASPDDGYHLNNKGCYIIGLVWFGTLTGEDISSATDVKNTFGGNVTDLAAAIEAAQAGIAAAK